MSSSPGKTRIVIIDPQRSVRNALKERLEFEDYYVYATDVLEDAYQVHGEDPFKVIIIDGDMADKHVASDMKSHFKNASPIVLSSSPSIKTAVHAIRDGAFDFVPKPVDMNQLLTAIRNVIMLDEGVSPVSKSPNSGLKSAAAAKASIPDCDCEDDNGHVQSIIGESDPINRVKSLIDKVAPSEARVLITGPNGTGKELVAKWLHEKSPRSGGPFVEVNCAAIPSELIESELFGHEKGAFTSAVKQRKGKFEQADGGTLFLDEIGDMSLSAQAKVLRALQESKISRVGSDKDLDINVRVVAATNKNLREEIALCNFREDLYHRLSVIVIHVPPLAERLGDIPLLVTYFLKKICCEYRIPTKKIDETAIKELQKMGWTGNIRELRNVVERLIILSGDRITVSDVTTYVPSSN